ncbi:hypothetical protein [Kineosporia succinea]|uniref:Uncharacterized protein n=1 Tax=Kineosporia succinea TaxID=84632 RepID=A0ABT9NZC2_9ACTN|nr:hypothetical protein [Kineosporia succinea]MDP9825784.1 hypothetical protein [Kineosporia succinea]
MTETLAAQEVTVQTKAPRRPPSRYGRKPWALVLLDVLAGAWTTTAGPWIDDAGVLAVITLGGHHEVVTALAAVSFVILTALSVTTRGFARASGPELVLLATAGLLTLVALAGLLSVVLLVVLGGTSVGLALKLLRR